MLLTDGANTRGVTPEEAAVQAAARGVRVYPIGFGTTEPDPDGLHQRPARRRAVRRSARRLRRRPGAGRAQLPGRRRGGPADGGPTTGGEYFKASDADQLQGVLNDLPKHVDVQERDVEVSVAFAGLAALLLLLGLWLAGRWTAHPQ